MSLFQWSVMILAAVGMLGFIFRLIDLNPLIHKWPIIAMHVAMAWAVAWGGYRAWLRVADFGDACAVLGPVLWLWISYGNWAHGVPPHFRKYGRAEPEHPIPQAASRGRR